MGIFHAIPDPVKVRMDYLEQIDSRDRQDGTSRSRRLQQITPETGRFLALMVLTAPEGEIVEVGTSAGYSTLWITLGARTRGQRIRTFEVDPHKGRLARETFKAAAVESMVDLRVEDARQGLKSLIQIAYCFMDLDKVHYKTCYDVIVPRLVEGGILIADNATSHANQLSSFLDHVYQDLRVDAMVLPVGRGELICRRNSIEHS
jgi:predicted O-methyltransferase YrrM